MQKEISCWLTVWELNSGLAKQRGSPPGNGLGRGAPTQWLSLALDIDFEVTEAAKVVEEKGDRRQDLTTDGLGKGFPRWGRSMVKSSRDWGPKARPQSLLEGRRLRVTTAQSGASEKWQSK